MCSLSGKLPVDPSASVTVSLLRLFVISKSLEWILLLHNKIPLTVSNISFMLKVLTLPQISFY